MCILGGATLSVSAQTVQCQTANGAWGPCPLNASVQLLKQVDAHVQEDGTPQKVYNFSMNGVLIVTFTLSGLSGSGCTLQVLSGDSLGNLIANNTPISIATTTSVTTSLVFTPASNQQSADQVNVQYRCPSAPQYPGSGSLISVEFVPSGTSNVSVTAVSGTLPVNVLNTPTVTANAGTNLNTSALALESGGNLATLAGTVSTSKVNVNISSGSIANTGFNVTGSLPTGSNNIGTVDVADSSGNGITSNSTTYTSKHGLDANILGTLGTAFTTAGFVDIKGADGNVFVRQATAANLNATVVGSGSAGSPTSGVLTVQGITSMTPLDENLKNVAGSGISIASTGTQLVGVADGGGNKLTSNSSTYTSKFALDVNLLGSDGTAFGTAGILDQNLKQVGGTAVSTATAGIQKVGIVGNAGSVVDASNNGNLPANLLVVGFEEVATANNPTAGTSTKVAVAGEDITGNIFVRTGGPNQITCYARGVGTTLVDFTLVNGGTGCGATPGTGLRVYITDITVASTTANAASFRLSFGTGGACITSNNALFPANTSDLWFAPANTTVPLQMTFNQPLVTATASRICVIGSSATATINISVNGFVAP